MQRIDNNLVHVFFSEDSPDTSHKGGNGYSYMYVLKLDRNSAHALTRRASYPRNRVIRAKMFRLCWITNRKLRTMIRFRYDRNM